MDIRFTDRWQGFSYRELYVLLDSVIAALESNYKIEDLNDRDLVKNLMHEINQEMAKRQQNGGG